jgi:hypothetical protein
MYWYMYLVVCDMLNYGVKYWHVTHSVFIRVASCGKAGGRKTLSTGSPPAPLVFSYNFQKIENLRLL